ncbi:hypothetical protein GCM10023196_033260 [Actinoallomurus vinaceus]|uniref:Uncharacterized protein n=1 Tax=Actinoallomurus vinaceus TaxID=1080074 RepID=A0ABP8UBZ2_9ACTN
MLAQDRTQRLVTVVAVAARDRVDEGGGGPHTMALVARNPHCPIFPDVFGCKCHLKLIHYTRCDA